MERKSKKGILIGITSLVLVMLLLVGLTYAYYRTRLIGNQSPTPSISSTAEAMEITYSDNKSTLEAIGIEPDNERLYTKEFSIENTGDADVVFSIIIDNLNNSFNRSDWVFKLYSGSVVDESKLIVTDKLKNNVTNGMQIISSNIRIASGEKFTYLLALNYPNLETVDQSIDMGETLSLRVNIIESNPYSNNTNLLAYKIIDNASTNANGELSSSLVADSLSQVGANKSGVVFDTNITESTDSIPSVDVTNASYYWTYADDYLLDEERGFTLVNVQTCIYKDCYTKLAGKYLIKNTASGNAQGVNYFKTPYSGLTTIYQVTSPATSVTGSIGLKKLSITTKTIEEKNLVIAEDDKGLTYYYRGAVKDNYVTFNNMCWRIVRIEGDGSVKLILEDKDEPCSSNMTGDWGVTYSDVDVYSDNINYGYIQENGLTKATYEGTNTVNTSVNEVYTSWYEKNLKNTTNDAKVKSTKICLGDLNAKYKGGILRDYDELSGALSVNGKVAWNYESYNALKSLRTSSLVCNGYSTNEYKVYGLTVDEIAHAGAFFDSNLDYYLVNDFTKANNRLFVTLSLTYWDGEKDSVFYIGHDGSLQSDVVTRYFQYSRPVISLVASVEATGNGTIESPYVIS